MGITRMSHDLNSSGWDHREEALYGLGGVRSPEKFYQTFGIHVSSGSVENNLCSWVNAEEASDSMHAQFTPHLRSDGMGIDCSKIQFKFTDPEPNEKKDEGSKNGKEGEQE